MAGPGRLVSTSHKSGTSVRRAVEEVKHDAQLTKRCGHCSLLAAHLLEPIRPRFPVLYQGA